MDIKTGTVVIVDCVLENGLDDFQELSFFQDERFERDNIKKLKQSMAYKSALYYEALKAVH